jgi:hypothetical protein
VDLKSKGVSSRLSASEDMDDARHRDRMNRNIRKADDGCDDELPKHGPAQHGAPMAAGTHQAIA